MKSQKSYADDIRQIIERTKHSGDKWQVKLCVYDTLSSVEIRNLGDGGTWFARQMLAVAQYAESFGLTFWLNTSRDFESGKDILVGKVSIPPTAKQEEKRAKDAEDRKVLCR